MLQNVPVRVAAAIVWSLRALIVKDYVLSLTQVQDALDGNRFERLADRMRTHPVGLELMEKRDCLQQCLQYVPRWRAGDASTFGHHMARFYEGDVTLHVDIPETPWIMSPDARWAQLRWRQSHDLRHVLLGLGTTVHEELLLHVFQLAHHFTWMSLLLLVPAYVLGVLEGGRPLHTLRHARTAWRSGRRARLLVNARLGDLLEQPIDQVRALLGIQSIGSAWGGTGAFVPHRQTFPST